MDDFEDLSILENAPSSQVNDHIDFDGDDFEFTEFSGFEIDPSKKLVDPFAPRAQLPHAQPQFQKNETPTPLMVRAFDPVLERPAPSPSPSPVSAPAPMIEEAIEQDLHENESMEGADFQTADYDIHSHLWSTPPLEPPSTPYLGASADLASTPPLDESDLSSSLSELDSSLKSILSRNETPSEFSSSNRPSPQVDQFRSQKTPVAPVSDFYSERPHGIPLTEAPTPSEEMKIETQEGEDLSQLQDLYQRFIYLKVEHGESVETITFSSFVSQLRAARDQYITANGWTALKFSVYVKGGRVALKAKPIKLSAPSTTDGPSA